MYFNQLIDSAELNYISQGLFIAKTIHWTEKKNSPCPNHGHVQSSLSLINEIENFNYVCRSLLWHLHIYNNYN